MWLQTSPCNMLIVWRQSANVFADQKEQIVANNLGNLFPLDFVLRAHENRSLCQTHFIFCCKSFGFGRFSLQSRSVNWFFPIKSRMNHQGIFNLISEPSDQTTAFSCQVNFNQNIPRLLRVNHIRLLMKWDINWIMKLGHFVWIMHSFSLLQITSDWVFTKKHNKKSTTQNWGSSLKVASASYCSVLCLMVFVRCELAETICREQKFINCDFLQSFTPTFWLHLL